MSNPDFHDEHLAKRLEWATSSQPPPAELDGEAAQWRESWVALASQLGGGESSLDTSALLAKLQAELDPPAETLVSPKSVAPKDTAALSDPNPRGAWLLVVAAVVLVSIAGGWWAVRHINVITETVPNGVPLAGDKKIETPEKKPTPEEKPSPPSVVQGVTPKEATPEKVPSEEELALTAWDDTELETALTQVQTQVYGAGAEWHESEHLNLLDERMQELDEQMDDGSF